MKAGICAQPARVLSPAAQLVPYIRTARGRPASRRISPPLRCLPRVTLERLAVDGMGENLDDIGPRLSGMWVRLPEAFAWVATRDSAFAAEQSDATRNRLKLALIFHFGVTDGSVFQRSETALLSALRHAEMGAKGRPGNMHNAHGPHSDIAPNQWTLMRFGENAEFFRAETERGTGDAEFWHDVIVQADRLMTMFPSPVLEMEKDAGGIGLSNTPDRTFVGSSSNIKGELKIVDRLRRGRPPKYPWDEFAAEAYRKLEYEGGIGAATGFWQADLERHMAEWCAHAWVSHPAESTMRERVSLVVKAYEAGKGQ